MYLRNSSFLNIFTNSETKFTFLVLIRTYVINTVYIVVTLQTR